MIQIAVKCPSGSKRGSVLFNTAIGISGMVSAKKIIIIDNGEDMRPEIMDYLGIPVVEISKYFKEDYQKIVDAGNRIVVAREPVSSGISDIGIARALSDLEPDNDVYIIFNDER